MTRIVTLDAECFYAEFCIAIVMMLDTKCRYAECHYAECLGAKKVHFQFDFNQKTNLAWPDYIFLSFIGINLW